MTSLGSGWSGSGASPVRGLAGGTTMASSVGPSVLITCPFVVGGPGRRPARGPAHIPDCEDLGPVRAVDDLPEVAVRVGEGREVTPRSRHRALHHRGAGGLGPGEHRVDLGVV